MKRPAAHNLCCFVVVQVSALELSGVPEDRHGRELNGIYSFKDN
eukprot:SAG22_NODE_8338_length_663_cov_0.918440_1_plen_43_part_10